MKQEMITITKKEYDKLNDDSMQLSMFTQQALNAYRNGMNYYVVNITIKK